MTSEPRPTFFIDWCLGKSVSRVLIEAGAQIEHHGDHFAQNTPDIEWLQVVGKRGWVVLTKDEEVRYISRHDRDRYFYTAP